MKMWILRGIIFGIFAVAYVNSQCNPSPCGINTQCEVSFTHSEKIEKWGFWI